MKVRFVGTGDAFAGGGRFQTCIMLETEKRRVLMDCGASSLIALRRLEIPFDSIDAVLLTHLHGDHFAGVPFLILEAELAGRRYMPLTVAGPPGARQRLVDISEALFPGMTRKAPRYPLDVVEMTPGRANPLPGMSITPFEVSHSSATLSTGLRVEMAGRVVVYSGDTAWTEALIPAAAGADLFIVECYFHDKEMPGHLNYRTLGAHLGKFDAKRIILTHMGEEMLAHVGEISEECAYDGLVVEV